MANPFHDHLDTCAQCRNHPMALCPTGARLLREGGDALTAYEESCDGPMGYHS